jgi:hypothetical protein
MRDEHDREKADREEVEAWKSPGGWIWLQDRGYYDDPPSPILLFELEQGRYDDDFAPWEVEELVADLKGRHRPDEVETVDGRDPEAPF